MVVQGVHDGDAEAAGGAVADHRTPKVTLHVHEVDARPVTERPGEHSIGAAPWP